MIRKITSPLRHSWIVFYEHYSRHQVSAAALSYYTLFALLPLLVMILIIARSFFLENEITAFLLKMFNLQEEVITLLLGLAFRVIEGTRGIIFAFTAGIIYLWSSFTIISRLEINLNELLNFKEQRTIFQQLYIYPLMLLFYPFVVLFLNVFALSLMTTLLHMLMISPIAEETFPYVIILVRLLFLLLTAFFLGVGYFFLPNGKVSWQSAFFAGLFAAILYQFLQFGYFYFQNYMLQHNPMWGAFAIFPLFLLWVNLNWLIILLGAEVLASLHRPNDTTKDISP